MYFTSTIDFVIIIIPAAAYGTFWQCGLACCIFDIAVLSNICDWIYENRSYRPWQQVLFQAQNLMNVLSNITATDNQSKGICFF